MRRSLTHQQVTITRYEEQPLLPNANRNLLNSREELVLDSANPSPHLSDNPRNRDNFHEMAGKIKENQHSEFGKYTYIESLPHILPFTSLPIFSEDDCEKDWSCMPVE